MRISIPFTNYEIVGHRPGARARETTTTPGKDLSLTKKISDLVPFKFRGRAMESRLREQLSGNQQAAEAKVASLSVHEGNKGAENLGLAQKALLYIRTTIYAKENGSYKSFNKATAAEDEISNERLRLAHATRIAWEYNHFSPVAAPQEFSEVIWKSKSHNCDALAHAAEDYIEHLNPSSPVSKLMFLGRHTATIIGVVPPELMQSDMTLWPSDVAVCDPWANIACLAKDYPDQFKKKMEKWEAGKKMIQHAGQWISPLDASWTGMINGQKAIYARNKSDDGSVRYDYQVPAQNGPIL